MSISIQQLCMLLSQTAKVVRNKIDSVICIHCIMEKDEGKTVHIAPDGWIPPQPPGHQHLNNNDRA